jgi:uncharacterized membrane protein YphA (DoxX/SURF4 family)
MGASKAGFGETALRWFGNLWFAALALLIIANIALMTHNHGFWHAWRATAEWFSPFNVIGLLINLAVASPGIASMLIADAIKNRRLGRGL